MPMTPRSLIKSLLFVALASSSCKRGAGSDTMNFKHNKDGKGTGGDTLNDDTVSAPDVKQRFGEMRTFIPSSDATLKQAKQQNVRIDRYRAIFIAHMRDVI